MRLGAHTVSLEILSVIAAEQFPADPHPSISDRFGVAVGTVISECTPAESLGKDPDVRCNATNAGADLHQARGDETGTPRSVTSSANSGAAALADFGVLAVVGAAGGARDLIDVHRPADDHRDLAHRSLL